MGVFSRGRAADDHTCSLDTLCYTCSGQRLCNHGHGWLTEEPKWGCSAEVVRPMTTRVARTHHATLLLVRGSETSDTNALIDCAMWSGILMRGGVNCGEYVHYVVET